jgi:hypothetical protein
MKRPFRLCLTLAAALLAGCGKNLDAVMWDCQFKVQQGNAGKSADDAAERTHDIEACMRDSGYVLDVARPKCQDAVTDSGCYRQIR